MMNPIPNTGNKSCERDFRRIQLVCQFGEPTRGLSPYADALRSKLERIDGLVLEAVDYRSAFPGLLHPAGGVAGSPHGGLSWCNPASWWRVARRPAHVMHLQHWAPPLATYLWPLAKMAGKNGKKVVITVHNPKPHERPGTFDWMEVQLLRSADVLVVHDEGGRAALQDRLGDRCPVIHCIPHGMNPRAEPVIPTKEHYHRLGLDPNCRYVLLFGNLRGYKGVDVLLQAWEMARSSLPDVRLVIAGRLWGGGGSRWADMGARLAGTARDAADLQGLLGRNGALMGVVLRDGFQSDEDIDALIAISEFAVFPYVRFSGQSGAASRAASLGRGVLVSRTGGLPELAIDAGWVLPPGDAGALAEKLLEKLSVPHVSVVEGRRQLEAIHRFDWGTVAGQHAALYRSLA
jgi:glycosyltransferase involved in cell wall biosynthesis